MAKEPLGLGRLEESGFDVRVADRVMGCGGLEHLPPR